LSNLSTKKKVSSFSWNKDNKVPILAAVHGTGLNIAKSIAKTGFAALASLDSGFYGKGIYFSTCSLYSLPYATLHPAPTLIISYVVPGTIYPAIEQHKGPHSLAGKPLRTPGYHSHYVLTQKDGFAISSEKTTPFYDEIVVPLEAQVVPGFIVVLEDSEKLKEQQELFAREVEQQQDA